MIQDATMARTLPLIPGVYNSAWLGIIYIDSIRGEQISYTVVVTRSPLINGYRATMAKDSILTGSLDLLLPLDTMPTTITHPEFFI